MTLPTSHEHISGWGQDGWVRSLAVVAFDVGTGHKLEACWPPGSLDNDDQQRIRMLAMPDCNTTQIGDSFYCFRTRRSFGLPLFSSSLLEQSFEYCYAFFRQEKNTVCARGFFQKSIVLVSRYPYVNLFERLVKIIGPLYFDHGQAVLEAVVAHVEEWPPPHPAVPVVLPVLGETIYFSVPDIDMPPQVASKFALHRGEPLQDGWGRRRQDFRSVSALSRTNSVASLDADADAGYRGVSPLGEGGGGGGGVIFDGGFCGESDIGAFSEGAPSLRDGIEPGGAAMENWPMDSAARAFSGDASGGFGGGSSGGGGDGTAAGRPTTRTALVGAVAGVRCGSPKARTPPPMLDTLAVDTSDSAFTRPRSWGNGDSKRTPQWAAGGSGYGSGAAGGGNGSAAYNLRFAAGVHAGGALSPRGTMVLSPGGMTRRRSHTAHGHPYSTRFNHQPLNFAPSPFLQLNRSASSDGMGGVLAEGGAGFLPPLTALDTSRTITSMVGGCYFAVSSSSDDEDSEDGGDAGGARTTGTDGTDGSGRAAGINGTGKAEADGSSQGLGSRNGGGSRRRSRELAKGGADGSGNQGGA
ncbi:unnamed protein product, partial [Phaeothamnion confervicola]